MDRQEAIQIIKKNWPNGRHMLSEALEFLIPELKESEDGRMVKSLKRLVKAYYNVNFPTPEGFEREDMIAWLEKQGEQKQKQYDIDILEKHITKDSISELAHTVIVHNGWEIVDAKEQKTSEWSEEDENMCEKLLFLMEEENSISSWEGCYEWLKSLKERMKNK